MSAQAGGMCMNQRPRPASLAALRQFSFRAIKHLDFVRMHLHLVRPCFAPPPSTQGDGFFCPAVYPQAGI